ncbi:coiled-coil domain-containing protein 86 [Galendromus occidentalis]|uniref:Coiled-coil domain-containing protein 86 n=1 Tax=Galendromus occidentalis TaxID=34638 RepID=A0AAJ6QNH1_9ACAR|nr:coiled-coil domain-containing protein 86 [Galendromus occidentalis]
MESSKIEVPRGKPKSGRIWKAPKSRFKSMIAVTPLKTPFKRAMEERNDRRKVQELQRQIDEGKKAALEAKRKRCEANRKAREANERKGEVVTVIKNTAKLKRMKKKQLRSLKKRDVTVVDNS